MESKNFDESIGMADFDYAMQKPSSLDIAISYKPVAEASLRRSGPAIKSGLRALTECDRAP
jgi:hypothetical protein